jgi:hypothetical protein
VEWSRMELSGEVMNRGEGVVIIAGRCCNSQQEGVIIDGRC